MEWKTSIEPVNYPEAVAAMEARVAQIRAGEADELIWLLEHPPLYTAGTSAEACDLIDSMGFPVYPTGRGGQYTYHGPGQRVVYVMLDLKKRTADVRWFVQQLERWIITTLDTLGVRGEVREGRVGVWVKDPQSNSEAKIAALGIRIRQWVTYHGIAINVYPDLSHFRGIVPCGIREYGVTSLAALGVNASMKDVDKQLLSTFYDVF
jgi:lipoyl(octanoyl) transferase